MSRGRVRTAVPLLALPVLLLAAVTAQQDSMYPMLGSIFQGQGEPPANGTVVYFSAFLERILAIDQVNYQFTAVFTFQLNWVDDDALDEIERRTEELEEPDPGSTDACNRFCTNFEASWSKGRTCCDTLWLPTLLVSNMVEGAEISPTYYKIGSCGTNSSAMLWSIKVLATFYTGMEFRAFPFDSQNLVVQFEQPDQYKYNFGYVNYNLSASGVSKRFKQGFESGDDVSGWSVMDLQMMIVESAYQDIYSDVDPSNEGDACKFDPAQNVDFTHELLTLQSIQVAVRVKRNRMYYVIAVIIPILVIAYLNFGIYFFSPEEASDRFGILVTLLLALMAVQFVLNAELPASSYPLPQQALIVATYCLTLIMTIESFIAARIWNYKRSLKHHEDLTAAAEEERRRLALSRLSNEQGLHDVAAPATHMGSRGDASAASTHEGGDKEGTEVTNRASVAKGASSLSAAERGVAELGVDVFVDAPDTLELERSLSSREPVQRGADKAGGSAPAQPESADGDKRGMPRRRNKFLPVGRVMETLGKAFGRLSPARVPVVGDGLQMAAANIALQENVMHSKRVLLYTFGGTSGMHCCGHGIETPHSSEVDEQYLFFLARRIDKVTCYGLLIFYTCVAILVFAIPSLRYAL